MAIGANILQFAKTTTPQAWICSIIANMMTSPEERKAARESFLRWDTNHDGVLSVNEI